MRISSRTRTRSRPRSAQFIVIWRISSSKHWAYSSSLTGQIPTIISKTPINPLPPIPLIYPHYLFPWPISTATSCPDLPAVAWHPPWWPGWGGHSGSRVIICPWCILGAAEWSSGCLPCVGLSASAGPCVCQRSRRAPGGRISRASSREARCSGRTFYKFYILFKLYYIYIFLCWVEHSLEYSPDSPVIISRPKCPQKWRNLQSGKKYLNIKTVRSWLRVPSSWSKKRILNHMGDKISRSDLLTVWQKGKDSV